MATAMQETVVPSAEVPTKMKETPQEFAQRHLNWAEEVVAGLSPDDDLLFELGEILAPLQGSIYYGMSPAAASEICRKADTARIRAERFLEEQRARLERAREATDRSLNNARLAIMGLYAQHRGHLLDDLEQLEIEVSPDTTFREYADIVLACGGILEEVSEIRAKHDPRRNR